MEKTIVGIFESFSTAERGLAVLERARFPKEEISVVVRSDVVREHFGVDQTQAIAESASVSALGGTLVGGLGGLLVGAATLLLPGGGVVLAAGALGNALIPAVAGAGLGAAYGGFTGALIGLGVSEEQTHILEQSVERGNVLVVVETEESRSWKAENGLYQGRAFHVMSREERWRADQEVVEPEPAETRGMVDVEPSQTIGLLNDLVESCEDGRDGLRMAAGLARDGGVTGRFWPTNRPWTERSRFVRFTAA